MNTKPTRSTRRIHAPGYLGALAAGLRAAWRALKHTNYKAVKQPCPR